jgi:hypothetical protein
MKNLYYVLGIVLVLVGILGFTMQSPLLGLFEVNALHSVIHLATGAMLLYAAMKGADAMVMCGKILGIVYAVVTLLGFVMGGDLFGIMNVNMEDNILHLALAAVLLYFGFMGQKAPAPGAQMSV